MVESTYINSLRKEIICICHKCRRRHKKKLFWVGNGIPRKYCCNCLFHSSLTDYTFEDPQVIPKLI